MTRLKPSLALTFLSALLLVPGRAALAQGDPGEVLDLAVHQGPNTFDDVFGFRADLFVFGGGDGLGLASWATPDSFNLVFVFGAEADCSDDDELVAVTFEGLMIEFGRPGVDARLVGGSVEPTDVPDCLIWDIVDGSVHVIGPIELSDGSIDVFNDPCADVGDPPAP